LFNEEFDSGKFRWGPRVYISYKFPDDGDPGTRITFFKANLSITDLHPGMNIEVIGSFKRIILIPRLNPR
jgi:hypothetical protein